MWIKQKDDVEIYILRQVHWEWSPSLTNQGLMLQVLNM